MNISIFGMGYVGAVCAACLSKQGHTVIGVDPNNLKVDMIMVSEKPGRRVGLHGLSYKVGTDDLRESRSVDLIERIIGIVCRVG